MRYRGPGWETEKFLAQVSGLTWHTHGCVHPVPGSHSENVRADGRAGIADSIEYDEYDE